MYTVSQKRCHYNHWAINIDEFEKKNSNRKKTKETQTTTLRYQNRKWEAAYMASAKLLII